MENKVIISDEDLNSCWSQHDSLQRLVYDKLIAMFMSKELVPGDVINRKQIAEDMNVSVAPVLGAIVLLEQEGFVSTLPRKGTIVSPAKESDIYGQLIVREALEAEAAMLYCGKRIKENYDELYAYASKLDSVPTESLEHSHMETIFHASLVNLAGVKSLFTEFLKINRIGFFYKINTMRNTPWTQSQRHVDLIDKLVTDNIEAAQAAIRSHLRSGKPFPAERLPLCHG